MTTSTPGIPETISDEPMPQAPKTSSASQVMEANAIVKVPIRLNPLRIAKVRFLTSRGRAVHNEQCPSRQSHPNR